MDQDYYKIYDVIGKRDLAVIEASELEVAQIVHKMNSSVDYNWKTYLVNTNKKTLEEVCFEENSPKLTHNLFAYKKFGGGMRGNYLKSFEDICVQHFLKQEFLDTYKFNNESKENTKNK